MSAAPRRVSTWERRFRILLSYHYWRNRDLDVAFAKYFEEPYPELFLDSGAFSAMTQGAAIDIKEYADYIKRWQHLITTYPNLDVIGDPEGTWLNQLRMEDMGLRPVPVFHAGSPWKYLERYIENHQYIALGGIAGKMNPPMNWIVRCHQIAAGRAVFHGFGITTWKVVRDIPWYSVDSTSWAAGFIHGKVRLFDARAGRFMYLDIGNQQAWARIAGMLRRDYDMDYRDFGDRSRYDLGKTSTLCALAHQSAERWLRSRHGDIRMPGTDNIGIRAYAATSDISALGRADAGIKSYMATSSVWMLSKAQHGVDAWEQANT